MCCLGVLLDVEDPDCWDDDVTQSDMFKLKATGECIADPSDHDDGTYEDLLGYRNKRSGMLGMLSREDCIRLGLDWDFAQKLASENDDGASFAQIADMIELELAGEVTQA